MLSLLPLAMDYKNAKQKLSELRDSIDEVLGAKGEVPSLEDAEEALEVAREDAERAKKSLLKRVKDLPVVDKITQLGAAGTVAVSTAAVTQTNIAVDHTEVFVASVANDVVEHRLSFPEFVENIVNFDAVNVWGQGVMQAKVAEVKAEVAKAEAKVATSEPKSQSPKESPEQENKPKKTTTQSNQENKPKENKSNKTSEETKQGKQEDQGKEAKESTQDKSNSSDESKKEESKGSTKQEVKQESKQSARQGTRQSQQTKPSNTADSAPSQEVLVVDPDIVQVSPEGPGER